MAVTAAASGKQYDHPAPTAWRFEPLVGSRDFVERKALSDWHSLPTSEERRIDRLSRLLLVPWCEVVAAEEIHSHVLEEQRPKRDVGRATLVAYVATDPRTASVNNVVQEFEDIETAKRAGRSSFGDMVAFLREKSSTCRILLWRRRIVCTATSRTG